MVDTPSTTGDATGRRLTRQEARARTRERLLDAAADVFKRQGYQGASLESVAEAAGYTKGAVYSNFATKADLFMALLDRSVEAEVAGQEAQFAGMTLDEVLEALPAILERQVMSDPMWAVLRMEFWLVASRDPEVRERLVREAEPYRQKAGEMIDAMLEKDGVVAPFSGRELGILINALATGFALQLQHEPGSVDRDLIVRAARRLVGLDDATALDADGHETADDGSPSPAAD